MLRAIGDITSHSADFGVRSSLWQSAAFPAGSGPDFVNAAVRLDVTKDPHDVLATLHKIEAEFDRERTVRWGPRTLDLDLIACDDLILPNAETVRHWMTLPLEQQKVVSPDRLLLPHPRIQDRAFVLAPLAEIAPEWRHPLLGVSVREMLEALSAEDRAGVVPLP